MHGCACIARASPRRSAVSRPSRRSTSIRVDQFEAPLDYLPDGEFNVVPLADVIAALARDALLPPRADAITSDDACRSVYEVAYPRFRKFGYPFTVFVATDPVDNGLPACMTWDQMREISAGGANSVA